MIKYIKFLLGEPLYYVGGCVRDSILGRHSNDIDLATTAEIEHIKLKLSPELGFSISETGQNFNVLNVKYKSGYCQIAQFRQDGDSKDGRHPTIVMGGDIVADAHRRDITINALYRCVETGRVIDPTGQGIPDIIDRKIRLIGNPEERIREDFLRVFRVYRFRSSLEEFDIEDRTLRACRSFFGEAIKSLPSERVREEIERMCSI
jgi:poly(A) polymerase